MKQSWRGVLMVIGLAVALASGLSLGRAQAAQAGENGHVVVSGSDVGFRITGRREGKPVGQLVIRQNGEWVEVGNSPAMRLISDK